MRDEPFPWLTAILILLVIAAIIVYGPTATPDDPICPTTNPYSC